jgi:hypothetical protein
MRTEVRRRNLSIQARVLALLHRVARRVGRVDGTHTAHPAQRVPPTTGRRVRLAPRRTVTPDLGGLRAAAGGEFAVRWANNATHRRIHMPAWPHAARVTRTGEQVIAHVRRLQALPRSARVRQTSVYGSVFRPTCPHLVVDHVTHATEVCERMASEQLQAFHPLPPPPKGWAFADTYVASNLKKWCAPGSPHGTTV